MNKYDPISYPTTDYDEDMRHAHFQDHLKAYRRFCGALWFAVYFHVFAGIFLFIWLATTASIFGAGAATFGLFVLCVIGFLLARRGKGEKLHERIDERA